MDDFLSELLETFIDVGFVDDDLVELAEGIAKIALVVAKAAKQFRQNRIDAGKDPLIRVILEGMLEGMRQRQQNRAERWRNR